jgi:hypothetical protein
VQFQPTISNIPAPDLGSSFLPNLSPLQSLGFIAGQVNQPNKLNLTEERFQFQGFAQSSFEQLTPAQRLEALSVLASAETPLSKPFTAPQILVVETSDTQNTDNLESILQLLSAPDRNNLQDASSAVSAAHALQGLNAGERKTISDAFGAAVAKAYAASDAQTQTAANSQVSSLSALLTGEVNELALATKLYSLGKTDQGYLLAAFNNVAAQATPAPPPSFADIRGTLFPQINTLDIQVASATSAIVHAGNLATCFLQYNPVAPGTSSPNSSNLIRFDGEEGDISKVVTCSPQTLNSQANDLQTILQPIYDEVKVASDIGLLQGNFTALNTIVTDGLKQCAQSGENGEKSMGISSSATSGGNTPTDQSKVKVLTSDDCHVLASANDRLTSIQSRITLLSSLQGPLQQVKIQLERIPQRMDDVIYKLPITGRFQRGYTSASVAIVIQPLLSLTAQPTTSTIATVPITYGAGRYRTFTTSTGVAFLKGKAANYSLQQQATASTNTTTSGSLCSGVATGPGTSTSTYCLVNSPSSSPQVIAPAVYLHYLLFGAKRHRSR